MAVTKCIVAFEVPEGRNGDPDILGCTFIVPSYDFATSEFWWDMMRMATRDLQERAAGEERKSA